MKLLRNLGITLVLALALVMTSCGGGPIEHGVEYVFSGTGLSDTSIANNLVRVITDRLEAYGMHLGDFDVLADSSLLKIRVAKGCAISEADLEFLITANGNLTFFEVYRYQEVMNCFACADSIYSVVEKLPFDSLNNRRASPLSYYWQTSSEQAAALANNGVFMSPDWTIIANCRDRDTGNFIQILNHDSTAGCFPPNCTFRWFPIPHDQVAEPMCGLIACKTKQISIMKGGVLKDAQFQEHSGGNSEIIISMDEFETSNWSRFTKNNIGRTVAIDVDGIVYAYTAIQTQIISGAAQITGNDDAMMKRLYSVLKGGPLSTALAFERKTEF